jgi:hypothetical protein
LNQNPSSNVSCADEITGVSHHTQPPLPFFREGGTFGKYSKLDE